MRWKILLVSLPIIFSPVYAKEKPCGYIPDEYAPIFRRMVRRHWPKEWHNNWEILMAQCYTESNLTANARSPVGAVGVCQIMPATFREIGLKGSPRNPAINIEAAAIYMVKLKKIWKSPRNKECLIELTWACYNAGCGNILKAQKLSGNKLCWENIRNHLPKVTGRHAKETTDYVSRNWRHFRCLKGVKL